MSNIISLTGGANLPSYLAKRKLNPSNINQDVLTSGTGYPVMSIKGKVFTLVKDGERKVLTRADDPDEVLQSINLTVVRANTKSRVFYAKAYVEGAEGEAAKPDCYSNDGVAPAADARSPQAKKCQVCPNAVWGSKAGTEGKGTACTVNTRLAVVDPDHVVGSEQVEPYLLRVPAGSRGNFADAVKAATARGIDYNMLALKVGFDKEAPSPKLTFKIVGLIDDAVYEKVNSLYTDETVMEIVGLAAPTEVVPQNTPAVEAEVDLDAALAAKAAKPVSKPAPVVEAVEGDEEVVNAPKVEAKPAKRVAAPAPAPAVEDVDDLLGGLDALLSATDD